jgi:starch phosphorylase
LYQEGFFRQAIDASGWQQDAYPFNEPAMLPIQPARNNEGDWLRVPLRLPGRTVLLRVWKAAVGRTALYLLDSNDPLNSPADRGITAKLYASGSEMRFLQDLTLGVAGWRVIDALHPELEVCHLNEGHAAFAVLERARAVALRSGVSFWEAFWATRGGNIFTTHTPLDGAFDRFDSALIRKYFAIAKGFADETGMAVKDLLALGRTDGGNENEPFNMGYLALRGSALTFGVSRLHGAVSRQLFRRIFPRWPASQVPVGHITNAVHMPSWDSVEADKIWTDACGKARWRGMPDELAPSIECVSDEALWTLRGESRQCLVRHVRSRLKLQLAGRGHPPETVRLVEGVFDPNVLTLGFGRRFAGYKRPTLLLRDRARLLRTITDERRPVQLVIAGKAHPGDDEGKRMIREWIEFAQDPLCRRRVVFLEDYDIALAQELVQGVDVWINTPRRPWEASGTSGMKSLVNGGLNLSVLDGWWAEAYEPGVGWAIDAGPERCSRDRDREDSERLYTVLEEEVVPEFYDRDESGLPRAWLTRVRKSMARLSPIFASTRLVREYLAQAYLPAADEVNSRLADGARAAKSMALWVQRVRRCWAGLHLGEPTISREGDQRNFAVAVYLGEMAPEDVRVELYADSVGEEAAVTVPLVRKEPLTGAMNSYIYSGRVADTRPADHFTVRIIPQHPGVRVPTELPLILWQR